MIPATNMGQRFGARIVGGARGQLISPGHFVRHGSTELGSHLRNRSRERGRSQNAPTTVSGPAGPMERQDWADALADVKERLTTVERSQRSMAQAMAVTNDLCNDSKTDITAMATVSAAYKEYFNAADLDW